MAQKLLPRWGPALIMEETFVGLRQSASQHGVEPDCTTRSYVPSFLRGNDNEARDRKFDRAAELRSFPHLDYLVRQNIGVGNL
jgi:hypothetical protein